MHLFFREDCPLKVGMAVALAVDDLKHAGRVLRLTPGEEVRIADGLGLAFRGRVVKVEPREILVNLQATLPSTESPLNLVLCPSLLKGEKMDLVIRQATELGVTRIAPLITSRSIPQSGKGSDDQRLKRWRAIVRVSAAQCQRAFLPAVDPVCTLTELLEEAKHSKIIVPWEEDQSTPLATFKLQEPYPEGEALFLLIGPEGGFAPQEIEVLKQNGAVPVNLGPRILRSDTAAAAALTLVQAVFGDLARKEGKP
jgi:16S rRNA (uracil1498-N3)-methyltransferase